MSKAISKKLQQEHAQRMVKRIVEAGYPLDSALAIAGHAMGESGLNPSDKQDINTHRTYRGKKTKVFVPEGGPGRGLFQHEKGHRFDTDKVNLVKFAKQRKKPWDDFDTQVDFMLHELNQPEYKKTKNKLMNAESVEAASRAFMFGYERPLVTQKVTGKERIPITQAERDKQLAKEVEKRIGHAKEAERMVIDKRVPESIKAPDEPLSPYIKAPNEEVISPFIAKPEGEGDVHYFKADEEDSTIPDLPISAPGTGIDAPTITPEPEPELKSEIPSIDMGEPELKSQVPSIDMAQAEDVTPEVQAPTNPGSPLMPEGEDPAPITAQSNPKALARQERLQARGVYDSDEFHTPFKIDEVPNDFFEHGVFDRPIVTGPDTVSAQSTVGAYREKPGAFSQVAHAFKEANSLAVAGEMVLDHIGQKNPTDDPAPENWTAMNPEAVKEFPSKYWPYITSAQSPNDQEARITALRARLEDDEKFASGALTWKLLGGLAGGITDPVNYLIPMASGYRSAKMLTGMMMDAKRAFPAIALPSLAHESLVQTQKAGGNLEDMATNAFTDTVFGMSLVGAFGAGKYAKQAGDLWASRKIMTAAADGIKVDPVIRDGKVTGEVTTSLVDEDTLYGDKTSISAARTKGETIYSPETLAEEGLLDKPYVGEGLKRLFGSKSLGTPSMQAARSAYKEVGAFFNRIADTGIHTGEKGDVRAVTANEYAGAYRDHAKVLSSFIRSQYYKANGMSEQDTLRNELKNFKQKVTGGNTVTEEAFGREVRSIMNTEGYKSRLPEAHAVADKVHEFFDGMGKDLFKAMGKDGTFLDPRTAWKYLPQNYNIPLMINRPREWLDITVNQYRQQDALIREVRGPLDETIQGIDTLNAQIKAAKENQALGISDPQGRLLKSLEAQKKSSLRLSRKQKDEMVNRIRDDKRLHILLEDRVMFDSKEAEQLRKIQEPIKQAEAEHNSLVGEHEKTVERINDAQKELKNLKQRQKRAMGSKNPDSELMKSRRQRMQEIELERSKLIKERDDAAAKVKEAEEALTGVREQIEQDALDGKIEDKFFKLVEDEDGLDRVKFYDPDILPKLRSLFRDAAHMQETAQQVFDSITNQTPSDLLMGVLGHLDPAIDPKASHLKSRSHLVDSEAYNEAGFLDPDISKAVSSYASVMGRIIGFKRAFPEFADKVGMEGILGSFERTHKARLANMESKEGTPEGDKERTKADKEYQDAKKFMNDTYKTYMGTYSTLSPELSRNLATAKNLVSAAKLGAVPIYQLSELGAILMKTTLMPFLSQGMKPILKSLFGLLDGPDAAVIRGNAAHAHLATNTLFHGYSQKMINIDAMSTAPVGGVAGKVGGFIDKLGHYSGNLYGTNFIADMNERWMASSFQSEVMAAMHAHMEGTITKAQSDKMARYGLDVSRDAESFVRNFENSEGWKKDGGYQSLYWTWADADVANKMSTSIRRAVKDTVVNGNSFTSPYWAQNPFPNALFMFHGWAYGALNHYAIPLMQRPDADNMLGLVTMVGLSMLSDPLLRMANGKDMYADDATWYGEAAKALDYSGILGPYAGWLQDINNVFGGAIAPGLQTERSKGRDAGLEAVAGPLFGYYSDAVKQLGHAAKGDTTQGDLAKRERLLPLGGMIGVRGIINKYIENSGYPAKRSEAEQYEWRQKLFGTE
jgi:hypothetical protein